MKKETVLIAAYGTLRSGECNERFCRNAISRRSATISGTLYDTGWGFPAFVPEGKTKVAPRSARRTFALMLSIKASACLQSAVVPSVIRILTGIPCASTAKCILVLSPLLSWPYLDCLHEHHSHVHEL